MNFLVSFVFLGISESIYGFQPSLFRTGRKVLMKQDLGEAGTQKQLGGWSGVWRKKDVIGDKSH